jgi:hypothetical protein
VKAIGSRAALAAVVALACICLVWTTVAAQPAVTVTTPGPEMATVPVTATALPSLPVSTPVIVAVTPARTATADGPLTLVLEMPRSPALWGDVVRCAGSGAENATVRILVEGVQVGRASPDAGGAYRFDYLVDRLPAGTHAFAAEAGNRRVDASIEVASTVPLVLLDAVPSTWQNESALLCTGNVTALGKGVPNAPVHLVFDSYGWADAMTGPGGQFEVNAGLPGGKHEVVANVSFADGRPLDPATSSVVTAVSPGGSALPLWALPGAGMLVAVLLMAAGGYLVRQRSRDSEQPRSRDVDLAALFQPEPPAPATAETAAPSEPPTGEPPVASPSEIPPPGADPPGALVAAPGAVANGELRAAAWALAGNGMRCGIGAVYGDLVARLSAREPDAHLESMTPRRLAAHFAGTPAGPAVARVTSCYEAVNSTWRPPTPADLETMVEGYAAALAETAPAGP